MSTKKKNIPALDALKTEFINSGVPESFYSIEMKPIRQDIPDTDLQTLYINFVSLL